jgi:AraC-like DNA-binding protein
MVPPLALRPRWRPEHIFPTAATGAHCFLHRDIEIGLHVHDFVEVNVVAHGQGRHFVNGTWHPVATGDVFVMPPGAGHAYENRGRLHVYNLLFQRPFWARSLPQLAATPGCLPLFGPRGPTRLLALDAATCDRVLPLLEQTAAESRAATSNPGPAEWLGLYVASVLGRSYRGDAAAAEAPAGLLLAIDHVVRRHAEKVTAASLAAIAGMPPARLGRLFRDVTGASPMRFLAHVRVRAARERLADPARTVTEVALQSGFFDGAHFTRTFRALEGITPREFRRRALASRPTGARGPA